MSRLSIMSILAALALTAGVAMAQTGEPTFRLTIKGAVTMIVILAIAFTFCFIIVTTELGTDAKLMIIGGVMTMGSTIVGVWFGTQATKREEPPPPPEIPKQPPP